MSANRGDDVLVNLDTLVRTALRHPTALQAGELVTALNQLLTSIATSPEFKTTALNMTKTLHLMDESERTADRYLKNMKALPWEDFRRLPAIKPLALLALVRKIDAEAVSAAENQLQTFKKQLHTALQDARHKAGRKAKAYVLKEWPKFEERKWSKARFCKKYVPIVKNKFDHVVDEKTMREVWLPKKTPRLRGARG